MKRQQCIATTAKLNCLCFYKYNTQRVTLSSNYIEEIQKKKTKKEYKLLTFFLDFLAFELQIMWLCYKYSYRH